MHHDIQSTGLASARRVGMMFVPRYSHLIAYMTVRADIVSFEKNFMMHSGMRDFFFFFLKSITMHLGVQNTM